MCFSKCPSGDSNPVTALKSCEIGSISPEIPHCALNATALVLVGLSTVVCKRRAVDVSPVKFLEAFAAHRTLRAETMISITLPTTQELLDDDEVDHPLSGSAAAAQYLDGRNTAPDLGRRIVYTT